MEPSSTDRLGLRHCKRDEILPSIDQALSKELIQRLCQLLKDYGIYKFRLLNVFTNFRLDEALIAFNTVMSMDTFALLDDEKQCSLRADLSLYEMYNTRLLRIDQVSRTQQDPLQRSIHQLLRWYRYSRISKSSHDKTEGDGPIGVNRQWSSQNTALIADVISRIIMGMVMVMFLIVALLHEPRKSIQIVIVSTCVVAFACLVSVTLKASNLEMVIVSAAYAAIISVFISNGLVSN